MREIYPNIDMIKTGQKIKECVQKTGYTVKDIQKILNLSCPQPIYRWFKGQILPSVDHLYTLSRIMGVHMEELIVTKNDTAIKEKHSGEERILSYYRLLKKVA